MTTEGKLNVPVALGGKGEGLWQKKRKEIETGEFGQANRIMRRDWSRKQRPSTNAREGQKRPTP